MLRWAFFSPPHSKYDDWYGYTSIDVAFPHCNTCPPPPPGLHELHEMGRKCGIGRASQQTHDLIHSEFSIVLVGAEVPRSYGEIGGRVSRLFLPSLGFLTTSR